MEVAGLSEENAGGIMNKNTQQMPTSLFLTRMRAGQSGLRTD